MRRVIVGLACIGLLAATGCGSSAKDTYVKKVRQIESRTASQQQEFNSINPSTLQEGVDKVTKVQGVYKGAAARLAAIKPPSDVKALHRRLVSLARSFASSYNPVLTALHGSDRTAIQTASDQVIAGSVKGNSELADVIRQFKAKGYRL